MAEQEIDIRVIRIIPWDVGCYITPAIRKKIDNLLTDIKWRMRYTTPYCRKGYPIAYRWINGNLLTLDIFEDGLATFSIHEKKARLESFADFDPISFNAQKSKIHISILNGSHLLSSYLSEVMTNLWQCVSCNDPRLSASSTWESNGFSYIFSYAFLKSGSIHFRDTSFTNKMRALLFPIPARELSANVEMDQAVTLEHHALQDGHTNISEATIADMPHKKIYFSWATSVLIGNISAHFFMEYSKVMRKLQHAWFSAYLGDQQLNDIVDTITTINRVGKLIDLDCQMSRIARDICKFTSISDSMATGLARHTYRVAAEQSGLNDLASSITTKLAFVRNEISSRIEKRNFQGYRLIEAVLVILTFIQAASAYKSIQVAGGLSLNEISAMIVTFLILVIFILLR